MLLLAMIALWGIWLVRAWQYFKWVLIAVVWNLAATFLFSRGGTLENPAGDGLITRYVRVATQDGPGMRSFTIVFIAIYCAGLIVCLIRLFLAASDTREARDIADAEGTEPNDASAARKMAETGLLVAAIACYVVIDFGVPLGQHSAPHSSSPQSPPASQPRVPGTQDSTDTILNSPLPNPV